MKNIPYIFIILLALVACERDTTIDLPAHQEQLVIEGRIETGQPPYIIVSRSQDYFTPVTPNTIYNLYDTNATVIITNGTIIDTLVGKYDILKGYVYVGQKIMGEVGKKYDLTVISKGKTVSGSTTIINPIPTDSVKFVYNQNSDKYGILSVTVTDPIELGNAYNYSVKRLMKDIDFLTKNDFTFDDQYINGQTLTFPIERPNTSKEKNSEPADRTDEENEARNFFEKGDIIVLKNSVIDRASFEYFRDLGIQQQAAGNPFGNPANVRGNINGGLGAFTGYSVSYDTIIAK